MIEALKTRHPTERRGRSNPKNLGRTGPGRKDGSRGAAVATWSIACALTSGDSAEAAATKLGMERRTLADRAKKIQLAYGSVFICDQGLPFRDKTLQAIRCLAGYGASKREFERVVGLKRGTADRCHNPEAIRVPETARAIAEWRDTGLRWLMDRSSDNNREYHNYEIIRSLLPELKSLFHSLVDTFGRSTGRSAKPSGIRAKLIEHPEWKMEDLGNFVCDRVQEGAPDSWHRTLCFLWEIESSLDLDKLRQTDSVTGFVLDILGTRYGAHPQQIKLSLGPNVRTIAPDVMRGLLALPDVTRVKELEMKLATQAPVSTAQRKAKNYGRPAGSKKEAARTEWYETGRRVEEKIPTLIPVFRDKKKLSSANRRSFLRCAAALEESGHGTADSQVVASSSVVKVAARQLVSNETRLDYDTVATYHKRYLQHARARAV